MARNDLGFILWDDNEVKTMGSNLVSPRCTAAGIAQGSRLKTPVLPIWVTCINNCWGVLFNPNRDLMKSYSAENRRGVWPRLVLRFHLFYYSNGNQPKDKKDTTLIIDTRGAQVTVEDMEAMMHAQAAAVTEKTPIEEDTDVEDDPVELAIRTK